MPVMCPMPPCPSMSLQWAPRASTPSAVKALTTLYCNCLLINPSSTLDFNLPEGWKTVIYYSVSSCLLNAWHIHTRLSISIYWNECSNECGNLQWLETQPEDQGSLPLSHYLLRTETPSNYISQSLGWVEEKERDQEDVLWERSVFNEFGFSKASSSTSEKRDSCRTGPTPLWRTVLGRGHGKMEWG